MKTKRYTLAAASLMLLYFLVAWNAPASAQQTGANTLAPSAPRTLSYQGVISTIGGTKAIGAHLLTVTLYGDANGTTKLWQNTMNTAVDSNGVFNCMLGAELNPLPAPAVMDRPIWLGVAVDNGPELRPLSEVTASAYALNVVDNAITTAKLADNSVTSAKIADSSITSAKVNMPYVGGLQVNGEKVTGNGSEINIQSRGDFPVLFDSASATIWLGNPVGSFIGSQSGASSNTNSDNGNYTGSDPSSTNAVVGGLYNEAWTHILGATEENGLDFVGGGRSNKSWGHSDGIVGGDTNIITGDTSFIGGGENNHIKSSYSGIGAGESNFIDTLQNYAFLGGGYTNQDTSSYTVLGGGSTNKIQAKAPYSVLGGGRINIITTNDTASVLVGGDSNFMYSRYGFLGGGYGNTVSASGFDADDAYSAIVGGSGNFADEEFAFIGGGQGNQAVGRHYSTIAGGDSNIVGDPFADVPYDFGFVGGGRKNTEYEEKGAIAGGDSNTIGTYSTGAEDTCSFIGGGETNSIPRGNANTIAGGWDNFVEKSYEDGSFSTVGGGRLNGIEAQAATIAGGDTNRITYGADYSFIGGGEANWISFNSTYGTIGGGDTNKIDTATTYSLVGGGESNWIKPDGSHNAIAGGGANIIDSATIYGTIGGGKGNSLIGIAQEGQFSAPDYSVLGGGRANLISDSLSALVGGDSNAVEAPWGFLGGGAHNISGDVGVLGLEDSFVVEVGGKSNWSQEEYSAIVGGQGNQSMGTYGFIGGGYHNLIADEDVFFTQFSTIGGGYRNRETAEYNAITGGDSNKIQPGANYGFIGGGHQNLIDTSDPYSVIGGGELNHVMPNNAPYGTIPGGDSLIANSFAQTVMGYNNLESTTVVVQGTPPTFSAANPTVETPLLIVGNGTLTTRQNAFEVTYDGHSIVTDQYGDESPVKVRAPVLGGTYNDNIVYAWGDVPAGPAPGPGVNFAPTSDFGVDPNVMTGRIIHPSTGVYVVTLNKQPGFHLFMEGSVTATPENNADTGTDAAALPCIEIACSEIGVPGLNQFIVRTYLDCVPTDEPFFFKVCGR